VLTMNILLEYLSRYDPVYEGTDPAVGLSGVRLLSPSCKRLETGFLYYCPISDLPDRVQAYPECQFISCAANRDETRVFPRTLLLRNAPEPELILNEIAAIFERIARWEAQMSESIIQNKGIQDLLTLSEPIIGYHIAVSDPSLKLLAYTKGIPPYDKTSQRLIDYGYHPEANIADFRKMRFFEKWSKETYFCFRERQEDDRKYMTVLKSFKANGTYSVLVVMTCPHTPCSKGMLDLFEKLIDRISYYVDRDYPPNSSNNYAYESLFLDLLEKRLSNKDSIAERCNFLGIPYSGSYSTLKFSFEDSPNTPIRRVLDDILSELPLAKGIILQGNILVLNTFSNLNESNRKQSLIALTEKLAPIMRQYGAYCGISPPFFEMCDMPVAYTQSTLALHYGRQLKTRHCPFKDLVSTMTLEHVGFFKYDDYFLYHMMDLCQREDAMVLPGVSCIYTLNRLYRYDKEHGTDLVRLLYTYLLCERKATLVAEMLHMHRNNVLYHIARIEEMLCITLDDPDMRFKLMLAYKYWELDSCSH